MIRILIHMLMPSLIFSVHSDHNSAGEPKVDHHNPYTIKKGDNVWIRLMSVRMGYGIESVLGDDHPVHYGTGELGASRNDKGEVVISTLHLGETIDHRHADTGRIAWTEVVRVWYPVKSVRIGDLVPLAGAVFRITDLRGEPTDGVIYAQRVHEKDLPRGVSWPRERHAIPLGGKMIIWDDVDVEVDEIVTLAAKSEETTKPSEPIARLTIRYYDRVANGVTQKARPQQTVHTGDTIELPIPERINTRGARTAKYYVRGIVPPDKERRVTGWILLESQKHAHGTPEP